MNLHELTTRYDIGHVLNSMGLTGTGVEVGVAFGEHADLILQQANLKCLHLVDPWDYVVEQDPAGFADAIKDWEGCYEFCKKKMVAHEGRFTMIRLASVPASQAFEDETLDFVYIDANHMRPYIDQDITAWWPKVKRGGIIGGHDYHMVDTPTYQCGVKAAVDEFLSGHTIHVVQEDAPSWYIIKP